MTANLLTLKEEPAAFYADLLNAFGLTVAGQKITPIPAIPLFGQRP